MNELVIKPQGWIHSLVFSGFSWCGKANPGISIHSTADRGGGAMTIDDARAIVKHLSALIDEIEKNPRPTFAESLGLDKLTN